MFRLYRPLFFLPVIYRRALFRIRTPEKLLCLTFDDGPDPGSTLKILHILEKYNVRAVFFCTGNRAEEHPVLMEKIRSAGHIIGNHGYQHLNGFKTSFTEYTENALSASSLTSARLFRPPYGRITPRQYRWLSNNYRIVMWDLMAYDFDIGFGVQRSLAVLKRLVRPGSIIVLHDKQESTTHVFLEEFINFCLKEGYTFVLPD